MRPDRIFTLGVVHPLLRASWLFLGRKRASLSTPRILPVLMYHSISVVDEGGVAPYFRLATRPSRFRDQIGWLADLGWVGVTLSQGLEWQAGKRACVGRPVAITFDDGFQDFFTDAFPVLDKHNFRATIYLPTGLIDGGSLFKGRACLNWAKIRELHRAGIEFGSHTVNHPVLYHLPWAEIESELTGSKSRIEEELGGQIRGFSYPYAFPESDREFAKSFTKVLQHCGYATCVTTTLGRVRPTDNPFALNRLPVNDCDDRHLLAAKLEGAYDWVAKPQSFSKACRRLVDKSRMRRSGAWPI